MNPGHLGDICRYWGRWQPTRAAVHYDGRNITWRELDELSERVAGGLARHGVRPGGAVAILMQNRPEYLVAMIGILKAGATVTPLNNRWTADELVHPLQDVGATVVITEASLAPALELAASQCGVTVFSVDAITGTRSFSELTDGDAMADAPTLTGDDAAFICYTSGTTGFPKGAILSHGAVQAAGLARCLPDGITFRDRVLLPIPLAFTGACVTMYMGMVLVPGATCVLERDFDPARCLALIESQRLSVVVGVPVVLQAMSSFPEFDTTDLSSLTCLSSGGSPVPLPLLERWQARGVAMTQAYGLTESSGAGTYLSREDATTHLGSAGRPVLHTSLRIVDDDDCDVATGEVGQILLRGPSMMTGYRNLPDETAAALAGGWLHTGDMGSVDDRGYLRVVDRQKDMIISGGINVYPAEIERVLAPALPGQEFAVVGVPHDKWGEVPVLVVNDHSFIDLVALRALAAEQLAPFKRPHEIVATGSPFPRSLSGKILKRELATIFRDERPGSVSLT